MPLPMIRSGAQKRPQLIGLGASCHYLQLAWRWPKVKKNKGFVIVGRSGGKNEDMGFDCLDLAVTRKVTLDKFSFIFKPTLSQNNRTIMSWFLQISYLGEELAWTGQKKKAFVIHWPAMMMISCLVILSCSALLTYTASSPTLMRLWCRTCIKPAPIFQIFLHFPPKISTQPLVEM